MALSVSIQNWSLPAPGPALAQSEPTGLSGHGNCPKPWNSAEKKGIMLNCLRYEMFAYPFCSTEVIFHFILLVM